MAVLELIEEKDVKPTLELVDDTITENPIEAEQHASEAYDVSIAQNIPIDKAQEYTTSPDKVLPKDKQYMQVMNDLVRSNPASIYKNQNATGYYTIASAWDRGWGGMAERLDHISGWMQGWAETLTGIDPDYDYTNGKPITAAQKSLEEFTAKYGISQGEFFSNVAKSFNANADYFAQLAEKKGPNFLRELFGEGVGGAVPGITEFILGTPYAGVSGASESKERGEGAVSQLYYGLTEAATRGVLGKIFEGISSYSRPAKSAIMGAIFGGQTAVGGGDAREIAKGVGTGIGYGAMGGGKPAESTGKPPAKDSKGIPFGDQSQSKPIEKPLTMPVDAKTPVAPTAAATPANEVKVVSGTGGMNNVEVTLPNRPSVVVNSFSPEIGRTISDSEAIIRAERDWNRRDWDQNTAKELQKKYPEASIVITGEGVEASKINSKGKLLKILEFKKFETTAAPTIPAPPAKEPTLYEKAMEMEKARENEPIETIDNVAVKMPDGSITTGNSHPEIYNKLGFSDIDVENNPAADNIIDGFITSKGRFVDRTEAAIIADKAAQLKRKSTIKPGPLRDELFDQGLEKRDIWPNEEVPGPPKESADTKQYTDKITETGTPIPDESKPAQPDIKPDKKLTDEDLTKARERGFITSVKEVVPELKIEGQYIPRPTDPLAIKARNLIIDDIATAERMALGDKTDASVAVTSELIKHYAKLARSSTDKTIKDALYEKITDLANEKSRQLTEGGRFTQAAYILGRETPEGQLRFAAREIQKYNEKIDEDRATHSIGGLRKKIPELTPEQGKYIVDEMHAIEMMPEGRDKAIRFNKLQNYVAALVPTSLYKKIITVWKAGLLTGVKTSGLNIYSNMAHLATETIKDIPATMVDKVRTLITGGERSVTFTTKDMGKGAWEGTKKIPDYIINGYSERDIGTKLDYTRTDMGKGGIAKALQFGTSTVFRTLGAEDQPFYYAAKLRSLYEQAKVDSINKGLRNEEAQRNIDTLLENPTEKMIEYATKDAEAAVFINQTNLGKIGRAIQKLPLGEVPVPFARTPSAFVMQVVNYSPIGIPKTIIENIGKGRWDDRAFAQGIGRSITGTAATAMGVALYDAAMIALDWPEDEKEQKLWEIEGKIPNSVYVNGKWRSVITYGPAGLLLVIGGQFKRAFDEIGSPTEAMARALGGSAKTFMEQTFVKGVNQSLEAITQPGLSAGKVAGNLAGSVVPTIIADVAKATDTKERRAETIMQKVLARIPGARQTLEPQVTVLGEERKLTGNPIELMIDPTRPSRDISTPVVTELRRLWDKGWEVSPALMGDKKGYKPLSQQENTFLWKRAGSITKGGLEQLVTNSVYAGLPDEKKADYIGKLVEESQKIAKIEAVAKKLSGLEGTELTKMIFELRKSGLATEDIIPIALSKRNPRKAKD